MNSIVLSYVIILGDFIYDFARIRPLRNMYRAQDVYKRQVLACEAQAELGKIGISKDEAQWIRDHANFEKAKVDEIEEDVYKRQARQRRSKPHRRWESG